MASLPSPGIIIGSVSSALSVRDAIHSYRRSQILVAESAVASASTDSDIDDDEEALLFEDEDEVQTPHPRDHSGFISEFDWDGFEAPVPERPAHALPPIISYPQRNIGLLPPHEETPLLRKVSFSSPIRGTSTTPPLPSGLAPASRETPRRPVLRARSSSSLNKSVSHSYGGQSTFNQTLFNATAILLGIGLLSEPIAFAKAGWIAGTLLIVCYGFVSCYTAKILAKIILADHRLRSYGDIGRKAFGSSSTMFISFIFCLELFGVGVVLVTLYADSLHSIIPLYSSDTYKVWGLTLLIPTVFLPLWVLSYASILGILSTLMIVAVVLVDGLSKTTTPGSIWSPAETHLGFDGWVPLGLSFGLLMAGFSGHAVIPSLARDMIDPTQFNRAIDVAFAIATFIYALIGYAGYRMFGQTVSSEISIDLLQTPGYNAVLNQAALWMLVISPLTKFSLTTKPLNATIEIMLGIDVPAIHDHEGKLSLPISCHQVSFKGTLRTILRILVAVMCVAVSILVPEFSSTMAFLGSFAAFLICIIGPIGAKIALEGRCTYFDGTVLAIAVIMAGWGTISLQLV